MRHAPDADCSNAAERANVNSRRVGACDVAAPLPAATEEGDSTNVDADALQYIDVDVAERSQNGHGRRRSVDLGFSQIEVDVCEDADGDRPPPQPEPPAPHDTAEERRGDTGGAARPNRLSWNVREALPGTDQLLSDPGLVGDFDSLGELLERQPPREEMVSQRDHRLLALGVRNPIGQVGQLPPR